MPHNFVSPFVKLFSSNAGAAFDEVSDGEFILTVAELFYPAHGARPRDIELGRDYLRESRRRRRIFVEANMQAYLENSQLSEERADPFIYNVPGTSTVITPESWKERAQQIGFRSEQISAKGSAQRIQHGFRHTGEYVVSVITSLYKGRKYIEKFLENIVTQTIFDRSELIIIDADSPEGEGKVIEAFMEHYPNIVYKRINHRIGIYDAWNVCVQMSRGRYLTNANLDDFRSRNSLELQAAALDAHAFADVVYQDYYTTFDSSLNFEDAVRFGFKSSLPIITPANLILLNSPHNAPMWRRALHEQVGLFDSSFVSAGDWEFWLRCASQGKRFFKINTPHVVYFMNPEGVSTKKDTLGPRERQAINRQYCRKFARPYLVMSRSQFAEHLGITSDWSWGKTYYDVVEAELAKLGKSHRRRLGNSSFPAEDACAPGKGGPIKIAVDGVAFQLGLAETSRLWLSILTELAGYADVALLLLDRGDCPKLPRAETMAFPTYTLGAAAADSFLIEEICKEQRVDAFVSTYYTTPITTPSVLLLNDEACEDFWPPFPTRAQQERELAIGHATFLLRHAGAPVDKELRAQLSRLGGLDQATPCETPEAAARTLRDLLRLADHERGSAAEQQFFKEWERLRSIQAQTEVGESLELERFRGNMRLASLLCTIAKLISSLSKWFPMLARMASVIHRKGVAMWNRSMIPPLPPGPG